MRSRWGWRGWLALGVALALLGWVVRNLVSGRGVGNLVSSFRNQVSGAPFTTPFGVVVGDLPVTAAQLDALGPVWYMDYRWSTPTLAGHQRLYTVRCGEVKPDRGAILAAMRAGGPSAWWSLGNEPNDPHQDNVSAEEYAGLYALFENWAAAARCHVVPAGIANADWNWAAAFREAFRRQIGRYPRVDAWNIHNYILEPGLDPYDGKEFQRRILAFRRWMESIGDGGKPLLLTEFGVLYGSGCCGRPVDPPARVQAFLRESVDWLAQSGQVSAWSWFATDAGPYNGSLLTPTGELNALGQQYRDLLEEASSKK